uniref:Uncharacterized protein n=1 Tax=Glossina palpalis gambiensis TaxID=67801 RepID=A0A1B0ATT2_9MUSC
MLTKNKTIMASFLILAQLTPLTERKTSLLSLSDYCTRLHGVSLPFSTVTKPMHNKLLIGREYGGPVPRKLLFSTSLHIKTKLFRRSVDYLSSAHCVLLDCTDSDFITGADDLLLPSR